MTALTLKQLAKVNAALCIIHDSGFDAQAIHDAAKSMMASGRTPAISYETTLNNFANGNPNLVAPLSHITRLIEASSPKTVEQYSHALGRYIETGDNSAMRALTPTIAADSIALAIHNGEMTQEDVANGGLAKAFGYEPGPEMVQALASSPAPATAPQSFAFAPAPGNSPDPASSQISFVEGPGMLGPKAQAQAARAHYGGFAPGNPALNGQPQDAAREATA